MVGFQQLQLGDLNIQIHLLLDSRVAGGKHLDLSIGQGGGVHVLDGARRGLATHQLADELLLVLHQPPVVGVKGALGDIAVDANGFVLISAPDNAPRPLLQIGGPPGTVQVVGGHQLGLDVGARTHLGGAAQQHPHLPGAYLGKQLRLFRV